MFWKRKQKQDETASLVNEGHNLQSDAQVKKVVMVIAVGLALFHMYTGLFGLLSNMPQRSLHLMLLAVIGLLLYRGKNGWLSWVSAVALIILAVIPNIYMFTTWERRVMMIGRANDIEIILGLMLLVAILELTRRTTGPFLPIISVIFLIYGFVGPYMPGWLSHRGYTLNRMISVLFLSAEGIYGTALGTSSSFIILFILFGSIFNQCGAGQFFIDLSYSLTGRLRGGPAKTAVISSGLMGSVSGSPIANAVTTGTITIPLMKSMGYPAHVAAAVEAVASTGGTIMPPMMGIAAFIMADFLGVAYWQVALAALIPAILYYLAVYVMVDLESIKRGIKGLNKEELPDLKIILRQSGHLLIPLTALIVFLVLRWPVLKVVFWSIMLTIVVSMWRPHTRMSLQAMIQACYDAAKNAVPVASATACAGIVVGVIGLTGIGVKMASIMQSISGGMVLPALILTVISAIILGMALPIAPVYIILASLTAPALIEMGIEPIAAHFFILYYAGISTITPPVCLTSYAAAGIAQANPQKAGFTAFMYGLAAYIVPFMFVLNPVLLGQGGGFDIAVSFITAIIGVTLLSFAVQGVTFWTKLSTWERVFFAAIAMFMLSPDKITDLVGLIAMCLLLFVNLRRNRMLPGGNKA